MATLRHPNVVQFMAVCVLPAAVVTGEPASAGTAAGVCMLEQGTQLSSGTPVQQGREPPVGCCVCNCRVL